MLAIRTWFLKCSYHSLASLTLLAKYLYEFIFDPNMNTINAIETEVHFILNVIKRLIIFTVSFNCILLCD